MTYILCYFPKVKSSMSSRIVHDLFVPLRVRRCSHVHEEDGDLYEVDDDEFVFEKYGDGGLSHVYMHSICSRGYREFCLSLLERMSIPFQG